MKKTKMSRRAFVLLSVLIVIVILVSAVAVMQRDNISAAIKAFSYTEAEIDNMVKESKEKLESEIARKLPNMVSDFTAEEEAKIMSGEMTLEDAVKLKKEELETKKKSVGVTEATASAAVSTDEKTAEIASAKIIEFYSLKAYYLGQLGQLEAKVIADYAALPDSKKNLVGKKEVAGKYMSVATSLLAQCDARVAALLGELENEINAVGGDLSIITTIKNAYENEKNLKKAYYMSKLK